MSWSPQYHIEAQLPDGQWSWRHGPFNGRKMAEEFPLPDIRLPDGGVQQYRIVRTGLD